ncbi:hypothetical protein GCM10010106_38340 [Thermopolyspora flexuosa]|uniref:CDP-alcohol phosphatidyltransferase-like enzyme n=1 Tax=Thermopolyspora flexuosa TaxID=103836 RepID=A0A543J211_9ACTN|nr:CDP-alcohol phosphatidyltransferase family protein [Thermopolyspora flexuosa]TQM76874.1 CDP-alcohol phosphatidyltransferase-like enzyme [Thermopolyspora flexuosa]GGM87397.1 hypothetical protein GCM10010106_38340 [Thermopolyspora flexuosa]
MPDSAVVFPPGPNAVPQAAALIIATTPAAGLTVTEPQAAGAPDDAEPEPGPVALLARLAGQLGRLPVARLHVIARDAAAPHHAAFAADPSAGQVTGTATDPRAAAGGGVTASGTLPDEGALLTADDVTAVLSRSGRLRPHVITSGDLAADLREVAAVARADPGPLLVLPGDLVAHTEAVARLVDLAGPETGALVGPAAGAGPLRAPVRVEDGRVAAAGNAFHEVTAANATFAGALRVCRRDLAALAEVAEELAGLVEAGRLGAVPAAQAGELLLTGLVRAGVPVRAVTLGPLRARRVADRAAAEAELAALAEVDEERARLDAAIKQDDGVFTRYAVSSWSGHLVPAAARAKLTPNAVTGISVGFAAIAAVWFSAGTTAGLLAGALAYYLSFVLDCVDGQLARFTRRRTALGAWLDTVCDRGKEFGVYAALAIGYTAVDEQRETVWPLAIAAMLLLALRHAIGSAYADAFPSDRDGGGRRGPARSLTLPYDLGPDDAAPGEPVTGGGRRGTAGRARRAPRLVWARRMVVLPIGERTALICVTAPLFQARVTFLTLLAWGGVATLYMLAGRVLRSVRAAEG